MPVEPVTEARVSSRVPPGMVMEGRLELAMAPPVTESTFKNCMLESSISRICRLVSVWPLATSTRSLYCLGKLGPVAVSSSGPMYSFKRRNNSGVTDELTAVPTRVGSDWGLFKGSLPYWKPPWASNGSGVPKSARLLMLRATSMEATG